MYQNEAIQYARGELGATYEDYDEQPEIDKKTSLWMGGVMHCFSVVSSFCGRKDLKTPMEDGWEVDIESISDMVYLGAGAQGVVFGGNLKGELVAVKKLRDKSETDIKHLRKLNHENIVQFRGVCTTPPTYCIIMEYCQYGPLFDFIHSGASFSTKQILQWSKEIALGMSYLHSHKIIHRDLKSPNVLISDNLMVKVSDFGTCREWNDVSAIMSFTGTVAWMAPEIIRHELCSEKVDIWSYGVVLWELMTLEIPYKNMETHAIMWGVGTASISLTIPASCPGSLRALLKQCWHRTPRNRPPFKIIAANLEIAGDELNAICPDKFSATQAMWREEIQNDMNKILNKNNKTVGPIEANTQRREELQLARNARAIYEQNIQRANDLYMDTCSVRLQVEQREKDVTEREQALKDCRCFYRRKIPTYQRQFSSSSDGVKEPAAVNAETQISPRRRNKNKAEGKLAQLIVNYEPKRSNDSNVVTRKMTDCLGTDCNCGKDSTKDNIMKMIARKDVKVDLLIEDNGNILIKDTIYKNDNDKFMADLAQV